MGSESGSVLEAVPVDEGLGWSGLVQDDSELEPSPARQAARSGKMVGSESVSVPPALEADQWLLRAGGCWSPVLIL